MCCTPLPESCRVFQWNRKRAFASAPVKYGTSAENLFVQPFTPPAVSTISVLHPLQQFPCKNRCIWRKRRHLLLPCRQICCLDEDLGVERLLYRAQNRFVFVIAEMKLLSLPCTKVTSRLNRCWSCCAVPRRNLPREEGDELTTIRAALERASRANSEMRQSLQNNILALREYFTLNAIQGIFRSKEIFDDVCRGIGLLLNIRTFWYAVCIQEKAWCLEKLARCSFRN